MQTFTKAAILGLLNLELKCQDKALYKLYENNELEYWNGGNADDTFDIGVEIGNIEMLQRIIKKIEEIN